MNTGITRNGTLYVVELIRKMLNDLSSCWVDLKCPCVRCKLVANYNLINRFQKTICLVVVVKGCVVLSKKKTI